MRIVLVLLLLLLAFLQYRLWVGDGSYAEVRYLEQQVREQAGENERLGDRNQSLDAEVRDLKSGLDAIEERARSELGMIGRDETFYMVVED